jgi:hypothetical protein
VVTDNVCTTSSGVPAEIAADLDSGSFTRTIHKGFDTQYDVSGTELFTLGTFADTKTMIFNVANLRRF